MAAVTRLEHSLLWKAAEPLYADPRRTYHTLTGHVCGMYGWWERFGWNYDATLDEGLLIHDVVLDGQGKHEERSAAWHRAVTNAQPGNPVERLVMTTVDHVPEGGWGVGDPRLVVLDLADFLDEAKTRANSNLLLTEQRNFGNVRNKQDIAYGMVSYLSGLANRVAPGCTLGPEQVQGIHQGIVHATQRLSQGIW